MFDDWKKAWSEAVSNFQKELADEEDLGTPTQVASMRRDFAAARRALDRLQLDLAQTEKEQAEEERQEQQARRRGELAAGIGDEETVRIANQWAERHGQRAAILRQKSEILRAELGMRGEDLSVMESQLKEAQAALGIGAVPDAADLPREDADYRRLNREAREKAAEARLEELKRKMR